MILYIDSNIFIGAILAAGNKGTVCKSILDAVLDGGLRAMTASLTFDEVVWKLRPIIGYDIALTSVGHLLESPLVIASVDVRTIRESLDIARQFALHPRDAIYAATMKLNGSQELCSTDPDFDAVPWITRIPPEKYWKH